MTLKYKKTKQVFIVFYRDNMEKVIYYLLLERKERRPSSADVVPKAIRKEHAHILGRSPFFNFSKKFSPIILSGILSTISWNLIFRPSKEKSRFLWLSATQPIP